MNINTVLVEDHKVVRHGLKALLEIEGDIKVKAEADDGLQAIALAKTHKDAIFIMDIGLPKLNGLESTAQILRKNPNAKILILTAHTDDGYIERAIEMNVSGYLIKQCSSSSLLDAIRKIHAGERVYSPYIQERIDFLKKSKKTNGKNIIKRPYLSIREIQVLQKIANGLTNKMISKELNISVKTVEKHRQSLMDKLSIHNTANLIRYAIKEGLIIPAT